MKSSDGEQQHPNNNCAFEGRFKLPIVAKSTFLFTPFELNRSTAHHILLYYSNLLYSRGSLVVQFYHNESAYQHVE